MNLDAVVARSRIAGGFSQHRRFTIAKNRAIEKMRRFALPNPHDYALEFVQAALANGARHVSMALEREQCMISYIGGGLREHELANLFDFLFASKDRSDIEHVRALALGINAALNFSPKEVVIESGDGTLAGTARMVLDPVNDRVDVGKADKPLAGSFIALRGIDRRALAHPVAWSGRAPEAARLEERCLCAPIPIVVDGVPLFGYSSQRTPGLFGYERVLSFDEGDLYGTIGVNPSFPEAAFTLLTRGVSIQTRAHDLIPGKRIGGVVCFDRLRKTVDHAAIVDDERLAEMWLRLRHHAEALVQGSRLASSRVRLLDGRELPGRELCELLRVAERAVLVDPDTMSEPHRHERAAAIGTSLAAPVLLVGDEHHDWLHALSGRRLQIVRPDLDSEADMRFFAQPPATAPTQTLATSPIELPPIDIEALVGDIAFDDDERTYVRQILGQAAATLTLYLPESPARPTGFELQLWIADRLAWQGELPSDRPGHIVVLRLPGADRRSLVDDEDAPALRTRLAGAVAARCTVALARACARALADRRTVAPVNPRAVLVLAAAVRSVVAWTRSVGGRISLDLAQLDESMPELRTLPVLRDHTGAAIDLATLEARVADGCGIVLAAAKDACPPELDPTTVIEVDRTTDALLSMWLGPFAYVRVDVQRWSSATLSIRPPWRGPTRTDVPWLPVDGELASIDADARRRLAAELIERLYDASVQGDARALATLQWCAAMSLADRDVVDAFIDLPVFVNESGAHVRLRDVCTAATRHAVRVVLARQMPAGIAAIRAAEPAAIEEIACSPVVARALATMLRVVPSVDVDVDVRESPDPATLLAWVDVDDELMFGRLVVRHGAVAHVAVVDPSGHTHSFARALAWEHGAQGVVRLRRPDLEHAVVLARLREWLHRLLERLRERVANAELDGDDREHALSRLLGRATRSVRMQWQVDGTLVPFVDDAAAASVLHLPVLESRAVGWVGLWWAIVRFGQLVACGETAPADRLFAELASPPTTVLASWLRQWSVPVRPQPAAVADGRAPFADAHERLRAALEHWLARLRPDTMLTAPARVDLELRGSMGALLEGVTTRVVVNVEHPAIAPALARPDDGEALAWALLAIYAEINAVLDPVLNVHELAFQQRVVDALLAGELHG